MNAFQLSIAEQKNAGRPGKMTDIQVVEPKLRFLLHEIKIVFALQQFFSFGVIG